MNKKLEEYYAARGMAIHKHEGSQEKPQAAQIATSVPVTYNTNASAGIIKIFAWIVYVSGLLSGAFLGEQYARGNYFAIVPAMACWISALVLGTLLYGFSEIIRLLQRIADNGDAMVKKQ